MAINRHILLRGNYTLFIFHYTLKNEPRTIFRQKLAVYAGAVHCVVALGVNSLLNMPRGEDPEFTAPQFAVIFVYPGTDA